MSNDEIIKLAGLVREIVKEEIAPVNSKVDAIAKQLGENVKQLGEIAKQLGENAKQLGENAKQLGENTKQLGENAKQLGENTKQLGQNTKQLKSVSEQVVYLTEKVNGEVIPTLEKHTKYFKQIAERLERDKESLEKGEDNIGRIDRRLSESEARLGIQPPPEWQIVK